MTAATAKVSMATVSWGDDKIKRPLTTAAKTYYSGQMMCINASGIEVDATDSSALQFDGVLADVGPIIVVSGGAAGDYVANVERPWRIAMNLSTSGVQGDVGRKVYIVDNQTVGYTTSNSVLVGWVDEVITDPPIGTPGAPSTGTIVLIVPLYSPLNPVAVSSNVLAFAGATGVDQITFPDNLADALSFAEGSNLYMTFVTTNGSELTAIKSPAATGVTSNGGGITATAGTGGTTSGTGGTIVMAGGAGGAGSSTGPGGLVSMTGGASTGSSAGGAASLVGGAGGLVSTGGAALVTGGLGGATSGNGGAVTCAGGAGAGTSGVGGVFSGTGGAGIGASAGGVGKVVGGLGGTTGAGGAAQLTGGAGGATSGTGGAATVAAGAGTGTTAVGGAASMTGGASAGASGTAGAASVDAGAANSGTGATVNISDVNALTTYINRGPLKAAFIGLTKTNLGTTQSSTPTSAQLLGGLIVQSGTSAGGTITLPTGTALSTACARTPVTGDSFACTFSSVTGGQILTITGQTGTAVLGTAAIPIGRVAQMLFCCTGSNTWDVYCNIGA